MPTRKVPKQSSPGVVSAAARALASDNSSKQVKKLAASIVSDQGKKAALKKSK